MKFREIILESGTKILLGKDEKSNDELMKKFKGKENIIIHTVASGSPFCVIDNLKPSRKDIAISGAYCAGYSQDWRDNKKDVFVNVFTGKDISKEKGMNPGTWKVEKLKTKIIKKKKIENARKTRTGTIRKTGNK
jgi:predicted ribosome quality control (RQC) complex YloA/Tae2 family protein